MDRKSKLILIFKYIILITVCICMIQFLRKIDLKSVFVMLREVGYGILLILPLTGFAYYLGTLSWQVLLGNDSKKVNSFQLFFIRQIGEMVGILNPTSIIGGDLTKIYYLRRHEINERSATNSVVSSRMTMILSQILLSTLVLIWLLYHAGSTVLLDGFRTLIYIALVILCTVQIGLFYWIYRTRNCASLSRSNAAATTTIGRMRSRIIQALKDLKKTARSDSSAFIISFTLALLHWIVGSLEFYVVLAFLGIDIAMMQAILMDMGVILIKSIGAFIPGQIGIEEFGNKIVLAAIGVQSATIWFSISLIRRFRQLVWIMIGCIAYFFLNQQIKPPYAVNE